MKKFARLVKTHSTFAPGLLPLLEKLSSSDKIKTIIPGVISKTNSNHQEQMELRITNFTELTKTWKLLFRNVSIVQEV